MEETAPNLASPTPPASGPSPLVEVVRQRDLILVTGKGGTGKSTLVAALAQLAAETRGGSLAVEFSAHPRLPPLVGAGGKARAVNIDAEQAVGDSLGRLLKVPALAHAVLRNRIIRQFIRTSPAIREMIALDQLSFLVEEQTGRGFPVIVDLPATGHALSFLDTPRTVRRMLRVGPLAQIAERVEKLLLDRRRSELVAVALPEELPINETIELMRRATEIGLESGTVVINRVPTLALEHHDRPLLEILHREAGGTLGHFAGAARGDFAELDAARGQIERLRAAIGARIIELPQYCAFDPQACIGSLVRAFAP